MEIRANAEACKLTCMAIRKKLPISMQCTGSDGGIFKHIRPLEDFACMGESRDRKHVLAMALVMGGIMKHIS